MSELRSAVESLRAEVLPELPDARVEEDFAELQRVAELLEVERLRRLAQLDRRRVFERDGQLSVTSVARESVQRQLGCRSRPGPSGPGAGGDARDTPSPRCG